ncbi:MAG: diaminopimelate decarboxylase [Bacteroidetes bacterium]|nr:diaminopimelate decarboxylase [Bacteroidota bacterium]MCL5027255.1 diaminopimelate decarboxylase [Chloroflexota bacterium]
MSHGFDYRRNTLHCEGVALSAIAEEYGTPTFVYSRAALEANYQRVDAAFAGVPHLICYSLKANGNLSVGRVLAAQGAGADVVSGGELFRARKMGIEGNKIVYASVGKMVHEIEQALADGILMFNVESRAELETIAEVAARRGQRAPIALRVNPNIDPKTHPYITTGMRKYKFGVPPEEAVELYRWTVRTPSLQPVGIQMHIGSQLVEVGPIVEAAGKMAEVLRATGIPLRYFDVGGGLGITYKDEKPEGPELLAKKLAPLVKSLDCILILEPGRFLVGNAGILLTKVIYIKTNPEKKFVIADAAMNDLIRPSLYDAYHPILPVVPAYGAETVDVVGPICESGDFLAHGRELPPLKAGDLLAVGNAGAYGFTMSSNYNARPRAAEVLVEGESFRVARRRENYLDLIRGEE